MKKMNNKGFSLVELIIVIAIMAILIVVLAPQYLKYVEKSRNSTDLQNITEIKTALEVYSADPDAVVGLPNGSTVEITITATGGNITQDYTDGGNSFAALALQETDLTVTEIKCSSKNKWTAYKLQGTGNAQGGIDWKYAADGGTNALTDFLAALGVSSASGYTY
ncbi:MAG: pilin [Lachnospiraceae bacterium]|nr:pilin [Lachnospiraceae bacterium]